jgi:hypothetical protein
MNKNCLNDREKNIYFQYLSGVNLDSIDADELMRIEMHLFECKECYEQVKKEYRLIKFLQNFTFEGHAKTVKLYNFIEHLKEYYAEDIDEKRKNLIEKLLQSDFDYRGRGFDEFLKQRKDRETFKFKYFFTVEVEKNKDNSQKIKILDEKQLAEKFVITFEGDFLKFKTKDGSFRDEAIPFGILSSVRKEDDYLTLKQFSKNDERSQLSFLCLNPGRYNLYIEENNSANF